MNSLKSGSILRCIYLARDVPEPPTGRERETLLWVSAVEGDRLLAPIWTPCDAVDVEGGGLVIRVGARAAQPVHACASGRGVSDAVTWEIVARAGGHVRRTWMQAVPPLDFLEFLEAYEALRHHGGLTAQAFV